jgi:hypothetical protein
VLPGPSSALPLLQSAGEHAAPCCHQRRALKNVDFLEKYIDTIFKNFDQYFHENVSKTIF